MDIPFKKNWKLIAPAAILFICIFVVAIHSSMKSNSGYQRAVEIASSNTEVVNLIGSPIKAGLFRLGSRVSEQRVNIGFTLSGPKGEGTIRAFGKNNGEAPWDFATLEFRYKDQVIDLH